MSKFNEKRWASDAILVQDACNLSGVVHSFSQMMREMCEADMDTGARNTHPCSVLFSSKIASLTDSERPARFRWAYEWAKKTTGEPL